MWNSVVIVCVIVASTHHFLLYSCCFHLTLYSLISLSLFIIYVGMSELAKERPANPVEWLAAYLIQHDPQRAGAGPAPNMPR